MGFLRGRKEADPDEERIRAYVVAGPPGSRKEWIMWSAVQRIAETRVAARELAGTVVSLAELAPASQIVRDVMSQDRDLTGKLVRKSIVNLKFLLSDGMRDAFPRSFEVAFAAMGLESPEGQGGVIFAAGASGGLDDNDAQVAKNLGDLTIMFLQLLLAPAPERPREAGWETYVDLQTGRTGEDGEALSYDLVAWIAVMICRLRNTGQIKSGLPFFEAHFRHIPRLTEAGWYPAPNRACELVDGIAPIQRYWDGARWTDRTRLRSGRDWHEHSLSLHAIPTE
jgi:hypothetical protein